VNPSWWSAGIGKFLLIGAKIAISLVFAGYLLYKIGLRNIGETMAMVSPVAFLLSAVFLLSATMLSARRWRLFIPYPISAFQVSRFCLIGSFFNNCLPGTVGGEVVKVYYLVRKLKEGLNPDHGSERKNLLEPYTIYSAVIGSVFIDHCMGLGIIVAVAFLVYPWGYIYLKGTPAIWMVPAALLTLPFLFFLFVKLKIGERINLLRKFHSYLSQYATTKPILLKSFIYSAAIQFLVIMSVYVIAQGLSLDVDLFSVFVFVPLINIILLIPVSISGIGLREGAYAYFFGNVGLPMEKAVALSFLWFLSQVAASLPGLCLYIATHKRADRISLDSQQSMEKNITGPDSSGGTIE
jgi:hypothetical protein